MQLLVNIQDVLGECAGRDCPQQKKSPPVRNSVQVEPGNMLLGAIRAAAQEMY